MSYSNKIVFSWSQLYLNNINHTTDYFIPNFVSASLYLVIATSVERYLQLYHERCSNKVRKHCKLNFLLQFSTPVLPRYTTYFWNLYIFSGIILWLCASSISVQYLLQHSKIFRVYYIISSWVRWHPLNLIATTFSFV